MSPEARAKLSDAIEKLARESARRFNATVGVVPIAVARLTVRLREAGSLPLCSGEGLIR